VIHRVLLVNERGVVLLQEFHVDSSTAVARAQALAKVPGNVVDVQQGDLDREQLFWPNGRRLP
jgi:hypothetical protein